MQYFAGILSLLSVAAMKYLDKLFFHSLFVLFVSFIHIMFWILVNQVRINIKQTENEDLGRGEMEQNGKVELERKIYKESEFEI